MSDTVPQPQKKKNKKKKKKSTATNNSTSAPPAVPTETQNGTTEKVLDICEVLPQKVGMTTFFNDVEVTMTHCGNPDPPTNGTAKKKKKKKKSKQQQDQQQQQNQNSTSEKTEEPAANGTDNPNAFIKLHPDHIELVNHPEISVTLSEPVAEKKPNVSEVKSLEPAKQKEDTTAPENSNKSKKKKKKKKKKNTENSENTAPTEPVPPESADGYTAPTYIKLPASGDNYVLLVSHENFSADSKASNNSSEKDSKSNQRVLIKSKDRIEGSNNVQASNGLPTCGSVSIIPITQEESVPPTSSGTLSMEPSLQKVKMELNSAESPEANEEPKLTKAQLKAERRAKQEAQRAAKLAKSNETNKPAKKEQDKDVTESKIAKKDTVAKGDEKAVSKGQCPDNAKDLSQTKESAVAKESSPEALESAVNKNALKVTTKELHRKDHMFSHIPQRKDVFSQKLDAAVLKFHPSILEIGSRYNNGLLCGSNARCVAFLGAFQEVIQDFKTPANKEFPKVLEAHLQKFLNFLNSCRPLSVSITNAVKFLKHQINHLPKGIEDGKAKEELSYSIYNFVKEEILLARKAICISASAKIVDGDHILVYAYSSVVQAVLCEAHDQNKKFHVLVVDSRPKKEGLGMLRSLVKHGLRCSYISINAVSYVLRKVTKVMIGAHALLSNGFVMSRMGCKQLSLIAASYSLPVMVCCETYKFCERALTDSFVHNELGDPDELVRLSLDKNDSLSDWKSLTSLLVYNILYDVTPSDLISVVITEKGILPCTSVPVVLRVKHAGL